MDGHRELERIVDHLHSESHIAAEQLEQMQQRWMLQSEKHPWVKSLKSQNAEKIKILIEMAVDVYNDSRQLTLSANSWPSRSLAKMHTDIQIASYKDNGLDAQFVKLNPSPELLQYRNPVIYREMLDVVSSLTMEKVIKELEKADSFAIQIDGSCDKYGVDNKFVTARFISEDKEMRSIFLGESKSIKRGAEGLLDAVKILFEDLEIESLAKEKLTSLTTDGENANTGKNSGLWVRMKNYLERNILCIWCVAHRSDLVLSDLELSIMEVKHWKANLKAVATFYRGSSVRFNELEQIAKAENLKVYKFPAYFEVRFVEHLINLTKAVWNNLLCIEKHWKSIVDNPDSSKVEKATARGFMRLWQKEGDQQLLTSLMLDILRQIERLQKESQRSMVTLPDIETTKEIIVTSLSLMESQPYPGGYEEQLLEKNAVKNGNDDKPDVEFCKRRTVNSLVSISTRRCWSAVRKEIVLSCKEFLTVRLADDQHNILNTMNKFLSARTAPDMINAVRSEVKDMFGDDAVSPFTDDVICLFCSEKLPAPLEMDDASAKLYHYFKVSKTHSVFSKLVQTYICVTPHSAGPERAVSVHTTLKTNKQSSYSRKALNSRMYIALNGVGTALFDPRPAVAKFLEVKERRRKLPDEEIYQNQEFTKKFFQKTLTYKGIV